MKGLLIGGTDPQIGANAGEAPFAGAGQRNPAVNYGEAVVHRSTAPGDPVTLGNTAKSHTKRERTIGSTDCAFSLSAPGMGDNLVVKVHYRLCSRNC